MSSSFINSFNKSVLNNKPFKLPIGANGLVLLNNGIIPYWGYSSETKYIASDEVILTANTERTTTNTSFETKKEFIIGRRGIIRFKGEGKTNSNGETLYLQAYNVTTSTVIGSYSAVLPSGGLTFASFSFDTTGVINVGDTIALQQKAAPATARVRNVTVCATISSLTDSVKTD